ncbi:DUF3109 family protein [Rhodohalobacter sp. SW132]|uniref:DUF3109 family protein n=1 Tax=Rhodohalobacter sp. SW132 TaxID=2293433 RepID=UPI000E22807A|nr:DUF3109 family protein [Rhodohalobacter sp. SW132]REL37819.1 DUF3109 family protein [Rhodohalobacter sp. SW132]
MFRVQDVILSEDIATSRFACDITRCKGACCVVGDAGAPVEKGEIPILRKAFGLLKDRLTPEALAAADEHGVVQKENEGQYAITCVEEGDCIFVEKDEDGVATCAIQNAYYRGEINWEKPLSCHLYPIRLKKISGMDFANFEYIPDLCSAGCNNGRQSGTYLSEFLEKALKRRYGTDWYDDFITACNEVRSSGVTA